MTDGRRPRLMTWRVWCEQSWKHFVKLRQSLILTKIILLAKLSQKKNYIFKCGRFNLPQYIWSQHETNDNNDRSFFSRRILGTLSLECLFYWRGVTPVLITLPLLFNHRLIVYCVQHKTIVLMVSDREAKILQIPLFGRRLFHHDHATEWDLCDQTHNAVLLPTRPSH